MRELKQRQRRYRQKWKRLRAKRKFSIIRRRAAVGRFLPDAIGMGCAAGRDEYHSASKSAREKDSPHQLSLTPSEDDPLCDRPESPSVVDVTKTPAVIQTRAGEKSRRISTSKSAREKYNPHQLPLKPSENDPSCDRPESLRVVGGTKMPAGETRAGEKSTTSKSAREKYSPHHCSLKPAEDDPLCDRPESLRVVDVTKTPADIRTRAGEKSRQISIYKSAGEKYCPHLRSLTPSEDDPLCDRPDSLRVVDITKTPADIETGAGEKSRRISASKSAREKYSPHQRSLKPSEDDPLYDRPDSLGVVDVTKTPAGIQTCAGEKPRRISSSKSAREKYSPREISLTPSEDNPLGDRPGSLRVVDVTKTPADTQTRDGVMSGRISTSESAREKYSPHQRSLNPSEDDPLCDRPESLTVVDATKTPADIHTQAGKKSRRISVSKSTRKKYCPHQRSLTPSEDDSLCHRPESLRVVDLAFTPEDIQSRAGEKSRRVSRGTPSILRRRPVKGVKKPQVKKNKKADEPPGVVRMNEVGKQRPLLPKPAPQSCFKTPQEGIWKGLTSPALPECEPSQPCTVSLVRRRVLEGGSPSTSTDSQKVQNQEVDEMCPMFPNMSEGKMQKMRGDDTLPGVPNHLDVEGIRKLENVTQYPPAFIKAAYTTATETGLEGICKMDAVGTRITTIREKARRVSLQISNEHAYCRKGWTYNNIARNGNDFVGNERLSEGHESYIVTEKNDLVSETPIKKNLPSVIKQKPVTVSVPKTHFPDGVRSTYGQSFKPMSPDPCDLTGIVVPLPAPDPDAAKKAAIRAYAPGNLSCFGPLSPNIGEGGKAVLKGGNQDERETARYQPSPEIARLDVLVRKRFKLPCGEVSYNLRKDGRPPFSYQTIAAMAIESDPLMAAKASDVLDFMQKHFPFYRKCTSKWWKHNIRSMLSTSKLLRGDRIGRHVYYTFRKELRLPGEPAMYEMTEEPFENRHQSEEDGDDKQDLDDEQSDESPEFSGSNSGSLQEPSEPDPLVPICSYSDDESDGFPVIVDAATYAGDELPAHTESEKEDRYECDTEIKEEPDEGIYCEDPSPDIESMSLSTDGERVYACSYCPAVFDTLQGNLDHSIVHPEVMKPCPLCNFSSPDNVQLLWHVNSAHSNQQSC